MKRKAIILAGIATGLGLIAFSYYFLTDKNEELSQVGNVATEERGYLCDGDSFSEKFLSQELYLSGKFSELGSLVDELQKQEGFESSPNCTYIIAQYGLASADFRQARERAISYRAAYESAGGLQGVFENKGFMSPDEIDQKVTFMEQYQNRGYSILEWSGEYEE